MNKNATALKIIEILLLSTLLIIQLFWYDFIGTLASLRGINYGVYLESRLENLFPIWLWLGPIYLFIWIYPLVTLFYFYFQKGLDCTLFRKMYCGFLGMMIFAYAFWLSFPVKFDDRLTTAQLSTYGTLGHFTEFIYKDAVVWNAFPSFHIAVVWYMYRINKMFINRYNWVFLLIALITMFTVLSIRIHYIFDIIGGMLLVELALWLIVKPLNRSRWIAKSSSLTWIAIYLSVFILAMGLRWSLS